MADLVLVETVGFVGVLAALSSAGRRGALRARGWLGRGLRLSAFAAVAGCQLLLLGPSGGGAARDPGGFWLAELAMVLVVAGTIALTARRGGASEPELRRAAVLVVAGAGAWLTALLAACGVRAVPLLALLVVAAVVVLAARDGALVGAFGAGAAVCVLIFLTSVGLYRIFPGLVPGTAAHAGTNLVESTDPYVLELVLGGVFGVVAVLVWAAAGPLVGLARRGPGASRSLRQ